MYQNNNTDELYHFGVKGMKWGVRKSVGNLYNNHKAYRARKSAIKKEFRADKGPRRGLVNAANSAARTYYRQQRTKDFQTYRKQEQKREIKEARLTPEQVANGRYRVANARNIKRKTLSGVMGTAAGVALVSAGGAAAGAALVGVGATVIANYATGGHYYSQQKQAYGGARAKYQIRTEERNEKRKQS